MVAPVLAPVGNAARRLAARAVLRGKKRDLSGEKPSRLLYGVLGMFALLKDMLDIAFGALQFLGVGIVLSFVLALGFWIVAFLLLTIFDRSGGAHHLGAAQRLAKQTAKRVIVAISMTVVSLLPLLSILPEATLGVITLYILAHRAWKKRVQEEKNLPQIMDNMVASMKRLPPSRRAGESGAARAEAAARDGRSGGTAAAPRLMDGARMDTPQVRGGAANAASYQNQTALSQQTTSAHTEPPMRPTIASQNASVRPVTPDWRRDTRAAEAVRLRNERWTAARNMGMSPDESAAKALALEKKESEVKRSRAMAANEAQYRNAA